MTAKGFLLQKLYGDAGNLELTAALFSRQCEHLKANKKKKIKTVELPE
jgi:hypothetical protein